MFKSCKSKNDVFLNGMWFSESLLSFCCGAKCCVNTGSGYQLYFGRGTRLNVEASESYSKS